ncbi:hypothetical protein [Streptomyces sp. NPDC127072]|uniref:hypothetical protein n=1 Tax=Streptomyces sp. NPDC127072 TaxID=3347129 RepID=UPI0036677E3D
MSTPPQTTGSPNSQDSGESWHSARSTAHDYASVAIEDGKIKASRQKVPENVPDLPEGADVGVYDQRKKAFYANWNDQALVRWSSKSAQWVSEHKGRAAKALADLGPSGVQGLAPFVPGTKYVNAAGIALQGGKAAYEIYQQVNKNRAGEDMDYVKLSASLGRLGSVALNTAAALVDPESNAYKATNGSGTGLAWGSTAADLVHDMHTQPPRPQPSDAENQFAPHLAYQDQPALGTSTIKNPQGYTSGASYYAPTTQSYTMSGGAGGGFSAGNTLPPGSYDNRQYQSYEQPNDGVVDTAPKKGKGKKK